MLQAQSEIVGELESRRKIMDAAETLFVLNGFNGASMRDITSKAGVALALANYHFGTKLNLLFTLVADRMRPINEERLARLQALERQFAGLPGEMPLEEVLRAIIEPFLRANREGRAAVILALLSLRMKEAQDFWARMWREHFQHLQGVTMRALHLALPQMRMESIYWNLHFTLGLAFSVAAQPNRLQLISGGTCSAEHDETLRRLIPFIAAGFRAGLPMNPESSEATSTDSGR